MIFGNYFGGVMLFMDNPCHNCELRKVGCHSNCPKTPSYDDWRKWNDERRAIDVKTRTDNTAYKKSLHTANKYRR